MILVLLVHDGNGAEELVGDVREDRRAPHGDAVLHHEDEQLAAKVVDLLGGFELGELRGEIPGKIDVYWWFDLGLQAGVTEAQATRTERAQAALMAVPGAAMAASRRPGADWEACTSSPPGAVWVKQPREYTPVATESMRNRLMRKGLQRVRGADDGVKAGSGLRRQIADGGKGGRTCQNGTVPG
jgi:hypothetical protein